MTGAVVLFRDSFDPLTRSHIDFARAATIRLGAEVVFSPTYNGIAPAGQRAGFLSDMIKKENVAEFHLDFFEAKGKGQYGLFESLRHIALLYPRRTIYVPLAAGELRALGPEKLRKLTALATILFIPVPGEKPDDQLLDLAKPKTFPYGKVGEFYQNEVRNLRSFDLPPYVRSRIESEELYYIAKLKPYVSPRRLMHSISVANLAYYIALKAKIDHPEKAYIAGIVHDIAKNVPEYTARKTLQRLQPEVAPYPVWTYHQFLAPALAEREFGITDPEIMAAISCHATGRAHMIPLAKILYSADKIEPTRGYDSTSLIQGCLRDYYLGFVDVLEANRDYLAQKGYPVDNPLTKECFDLYLGEK